MFLQKEFAFFKGLLYIILLGELYPLGAIMLQELYDKLMLNIMIDSQIGCWLYTKRLDQQGYGLVHFCGEDLRAHRVMYFISKGKEIDETDLHHTCQNKACINPTHLQEVTSKEHGILHRKYSPEYYINKEKLSKHYIELKKVVLNSDIDEEDKKAIKEILGKEKGVSLASILEEGEN